ncbi:hypothetical protein ElyMa_005979000 [Elysia marginata]|uniref:Uncharacterized protein n=1 Tax=Elysia marginata TaxID=1093978 RepID=A0AAV4GES5_9GAST|nr:hypothetical protein ElyMa_005979000 [Elysia marginata]
MQTEDRARQFHADGRQSKTASCRRKTERDSFIQTEDRARQLHSGIASNRRDERQSKTASCTRKTEQDSFMQTEDRARQLLHAGSDRSTEYEVNFSCFILYLKALDAFARLRYIC